MVRQSSGEPVVEPAAKSEQWSLDALFADAVNDLVPLLPEADGSGQERGRILQVGGEQQQDGGAARVADAVERGAKGTDVSRVEDDLDAPVGAGEFAQHVRGGVG